MCVLTSFVSVCVCVRESVCVCVCFQVGVVGDGSNAMETFDNREVISASDAVR